MGIDIFTKKATEKSIEKITGKLEDLNDPAENLVDAINRKSSGGGVDLDRTLTDPTKAAPADLVGTLKGDIDDVKLELTGVSALADSISEVVG